MMEDLEKGMTFEPVSAENSGKFVELFGSRGACGNCWCMAYRLPRKEFDLGKANDGNRKAMLKLIGEGKPAGLMGFADGRPAGWCAFAPREDFTRLERSKVHKRIDDLPVWSIPCLFVDRQYRNKGVSLQLLKAVIRYAGEKGIGCIEAYPTIPTKGRLPDPFVWTGLFTTFLKAGFTVADRKSKNRPMVRYYVTR